jgi:hypothetical protein
MKVMVFVKATLSERAGLTDQLKPSKRSPLHGF